MRTEDGCNATTQGNDRAAIPPPIAILLDALKESPTLSRLPLTLLCAEKTLQWLALVECARAVAAQKPPSRDLSFETVSVGQWLFMLREAAHATGSSTLAWLSSSLPRNDARSAWLGTVRQKSRPWRVSDFLTSVIEYRNRLSHPKSIPSASALSAELPLLEESLRVTLTSPDRSAGTILADPVTGSDVYWSESNVVIPLFPFVLGPTPELPVWRLLQACTRSRTHYFVASDRTTNAVSPSSERALNIVRFFGRGESRARSTYVVTLRSLAPLFELHVCFGGHADLGRGERCEFSLPQASAAVSQNHAGIRWSEEAGRFLLADHDSRNGTFVNGARVRESALATCDQIHLGSRLSFQVEVVGDVCALVFGDGSEEMARYVLCPRPEVEMNTSSAPVRWPWSAAPSAIVLTNDGLVLDLSSDPNPRIVPLRNATCIVTDERLLSVEVRQWQDGRR